MSPNFSGEQTIEIQITSVLKVSRYLAKEPKTYGISSLRGEPEGSRSKLRSTPYIRNCLRPNFMTSSLSASNLPSIPKNLFSKSPTERPLVKNHSRDFTLRESSPSLQRKMQKGSKTLPQICRKTQSGKGTTVSFPSGD
ncbi:hypothetical protein AVEN_102616-1 [Araneus ventricosus]|uniref:Uncharacterized protein n=1 Tax=Araneus ventricosus TaxID=182803 RepID=A0A4Y2BIK5_ARAVE|nr:hypothetical protein AVEN_102616-1 [Araneus ventricosus]